MITDRKEDSLMKGKIRKAAPSGAAFAYLTEKTDPEIHRSEGCCWERAEKWAKVSGGKPA
ncbi:hypothetical protein [Parabacteroides merdae]|uniref:hypothetical protein n=1 Tax=Parabacteroides merdae TaxID=46503 RepID=UPI0012B6395F|nr:hypothetical protein [Parabacteroides merdae]